jgi:hypothetical protein
MDSIKVSKCFFKMLTIKERHKVTHLCTYFLTVSLYVGSSNTCQKKLDSSDKRSSASCFSMVGSSDNHLTSALTVSFWGLAAPLHLLLT